MLVANICRISVPCGLLIALCACGSLLPETKTITPSAWKSFDEAQAAAQHIVPFKTSQAELKALGFDAASIPNIVMLNYSDILLRFVPAAETKIVTQDKGLLSCLAAASACRGIEVNVSGQHSERVGGFWTDFFNFHRDSHITGWRFSAIVLLKGDVVVYRTWGGEPRIEKDEHTSNPLGPLQNLGDVQPHR